MLFSRAKLDTVDDGLLFRGSLLRVTTLLGALTWFFLVFRINPSLLGSDFWS